MGNYTFVCTVLKSIDIFNGTLLKLIIVENFHGTLTTVVRAQNDTSKTANITDVIFDRSDSVLKIRQIRRSVSC